MNDAFRSQLMATTTDEPIPAIVRYRSSAAMAAFGAAAPDVRVMVTYQYNLIPAQAISATSQSLLALADNPAVDQVWPDLPVHTMLDVSVPLIRAPQMWNLGFEGQGVRVAVVDTGIDPDHPDFEGRIVAMQDFTQSGGSGRDGNGHGTHVSSTIGGSGEASGGKYIGVAPEVELLAAKVLRDDGSGMTSDVMAGVEWAVQQNAHVINLSLGSNVRCDGTDALSALCDQAVAQGVVVCVAAGNAGPGAGTVGSPGCARNVITIGATTDTDQVTSFSSRGPTSDGRVKPDVCFPGYNIVAARAKGTAMGTPVDAYYTSASGTSMATPHAAGASALLLQALPGLTPEQVKARLMGSAIDLGLDSNTQGSGRGDILAAYEYGGGTPPPPTPPPPEPQPGGCNPFASSQRTEAGEVRTGVAKEFWWILGILLVLCICVTCATATLLAIALTTS